jgi:hypothetical protein
VHTGFTAEKYDEIYIACILCLHGVATTIISDRGNLKAAKSHQESYANKRHQPLEFEVGNRVYLHVSLMKDVKRFIGERLYHIHSYLEQ